ncbi:RHS repeat-associated core domain-containing protein [Myxococcus sp. CA040A]|uniref:RHS repeat-associated core domain-containing protein n=1 Tax=Myxococcus sp. CA040A TaxID=2741738 RepID=UPI001C2CCF60|nr:RHS repeat-associated core domain-containing protein [Myxococcus sp. CA040A]NTX06554.1 RHS repeat-associated core domain-containing protein [Myxococcus sp. CA040A]
MDGVLGPCRPVTAQSLDACGNNCDDDRSGEADEGCAGSGTFDYCERNPTGGGYTRWTCGCGDGLNVGYCLGSGDSQASCSNPEGCLKAPAFGTSGSSQAGGNFQCCVSNLPCGGEGYVPGALHCTSWDTPNFECTPGASCDDSNACGNTCAGIAPQVDRTSGVRVGSGGYCAAGPVCRHAQGGFGPSSGGGVRGMLDNDWTQTVYEVCGIATMDGQSTMTCINVPVRTDPPPTLPSRPDGPPGGGGGGGGGDGDDGEGDPDVKDPEPKTCGPDGSAVVGAGVSGMSVPRVSLGDLTTRYTAADVGLHGELGGFNFVRHYVSTDKFWTYLSMLGFSGDDFVPKPFGSSPSRQHSARWWHSLYSFVNVKGNVPGVSTWVVRDTDGEVLEFFACGGGGTACFAKPRQVARYSNASLYWSGSHFVLIKPGQGRFVYAATWAAPTKPNRRYFLSRIEEDRLAGTPRVRLSLAYAPLTVADGSTTLTCPGQSTHGNGAPYLSTVTTEEGAKLRLYYRAVKGAFFAPSKECVLDRVALLKNPNSTDSVLSQEEVVVAKYYYHSPLGDGVEQAGLLTRIEYPETGDVVDIMDTTADGTTSAAWNVAVNQSAVVSHQYQSGKVSGMSSGTASATSMSTGSGDCSGPSPMGGGSTCVPPAAVPPAVSAGDSAGSTVQFRRDLLSYESPYSPASLLSYYQDVCISGSGNCTSVAQGYVDYDYSEPANGSLVLRYVRHKSGAYSFNNMTFASAGSASVPGVISPVQQVVQSSGKDYLGNGGLTGPTTDFVYASFPVGATSTPWKPVRQTVTSEASVLQSGGQAFIRTTYDEVTRFKKSVIRSGYTQTFNGTSGTWTDSVEQHMGVFYFNHHRCSGGTDTGGSVVKEVHGPCVVSSSTATDCSGSDYPITQYTYYGPPGAENSNRANRLMKVSRYSYHASGYCSPYPPEETVYSAYDARGNATQITSPNGDVTSLQYQGGRLTAMTSQGLTSTLLYDGAQLRAVQLPTGNYSVYCYRTGTTPGAGCAGGQKTTQLQWVAIAADALGVDWSEMSIKTYWPNGLLKTEEARTRRAGVEESRRKTTFHPDPHQRPTFSRQGVGAGSFSSVKAFDLNDNLIAVGKPLNEAPDFCRETGSMPALSVLCTTLGYDSSDRLIRASESFPGGLQQHSTFAYDAQQNISGVRTGCSSAVDGCGLLTSYQYDDFGNLVKVKFPHADGFVRQAYDARGFVVVKQTPTMSAQGEWLEYSHDLLNRPRGAFRRRGGTTPLTEALYWLGYDSDGSLVSGCGGGELNSMGLLRYRDDSFGRTWYRYDTGGRLVSEHRQRQGDSGCTPEMETRYTYDSLGRLSGLIHPYGREVSYIYGTGARAHQVLHIDVEIFTNTGSETRRLVSDIVWEPFGGLRGYQLNPLSGTSRAVEYALGDDGHLPPANCGVGFPSSLGSDLTGRLRSLRVSSGAFTPGTGGGDIYKRTYTWKADQVARTDTCLLGATTARTELFDYDRALRLTSATRPSGNSDATGGTFYAQAYGYDRSGNRTSFAPSGLSSDLLVYGTGDAGARLLSTTPSNDAFQRLGYTYDADGRVVRKQVGHYVSNQPAHVLELGYSSFDEAEEHGSARDTVFRAVTVNGATYNYFYDALGRRRAKVNPFGQRDEFFHGTSHELLVDQGWSDVVSSSFRVTDDYVWLAGRPVVLLRGKLDANDPVRQPDSTADCRRNGETAACGVYFPVTDHIGKPVLMLDKAGKVAGAADYDPFGHVNRSASRDGTAHPYAYDDSESFSGFSQQAENSQVQLRLRALFQFIDTRDDVNGVDEVELVDTDTSTVLARYKGAELGRVVTPWLQPSAGRMTLFFTAEPQGGSTSSFSGVAVEGYEYQRFQVGAQPFWTPMRFPGQYHDEETDLFENWNRNYDPSIGRYLQPEPILQDPGYSREMAEKGYGVPAYAYAANNPLYWSDPTGLAFDETCWAACIDEVNPLENNPLMCGDSDSSTGNDGSDFPWGSAISLAAGPYWKPFGYQAGASHFTSPWRLMNIASRSVSGRPVFPGPATKLMGRASVMWIVAAGITSWGVIGACAAECSGR